MKTTINIGLEKNIGGTIETDYALHKVKQLVNVDKYKVRKSNTERTLVISTEEFVSNKQIERLSDDLYQDAIALKRGDKGTMVHGKNALNDWGEFNDKYFITL